MRCLSRRPPGRRGQARWTGCTTTSSPGAEFDAHGRSPASCWSGRRAPATATAPRAARWRAARRRACPALLEIDLQGARQVRAAMPDALLRLPRPAARRSWCAGWSAGAPRTPRRSRAAAGPRARRAGRRAGVRRDHRQRPSRAGRRRTWYDCWVRPARWAWPAATLALSSRPVLTRELDTRVRHRRPPEGITNPPIDELLETDRPPSTRLVIFAAKRARQINAYYCQLGEGLLEYVGPLVETTPQEKPLSIALREINAGC